MPKHTLSLSKEQIKAQIDSLEISQASVVVQMFGGIRPMAKKLDVPVTTVQGWKKRDVVPVGRVKHLIDTATDLDLDVDHIESLLVLPTVGPTEVEVSRKIGANPPTREVPQKVAKAQTVKPEKQNLLSQSASVSDTMTTSRATKDVKHSSSSNRANNRVDPVSTQETSTKKSSIFSFANALIAIVGLLFAGLLYLFMAGHSEKSSTASATSELNTKLAALEQSQADRATEVATKLQALSDDNAELRAKLSSVEESLKAEQANLGLTTTQLVDEKSQELDGKLTGEITSLKEATNLKLSDLTTSIANLDLKSESNLPAVQTAEELPDDLVRAGDLEKVVSDVSSKLGSFEESVSTQFRQVEAKISAETAARVESFDVLQQNLVSLQEKSLGEVASVSGLVVGLSSATSEIQDKLTTLDLRQTELASSQTALKDETLRIQVQANQSANRLLAASRLRSTINSNGPFDTELAYLRQFTEGDEVIDTLAASVEDVAQVGVASLAELQAEFQAISTRLLNEELAAQTVDGSKSDQLKAGLVNLFGVTKQDGSAIVTASESQLEGPLNKIQQALSKEDLESARTQIEALELKAFDELGPKIEARQRVLVAATNLDDWLSNLGSN